MKGNQAVHRKSLNAVAVFRAILSFASPMGLRGQAANTQAQPNPRDLRTQQPAFFQPFEGLQSIGEIASRQEFDVVALSDNIATTAEDRIYAANTMLRMYGCIASEADRARGRPILREHLPYYSWQLDHEAERTTGFHGVYKSAGGGSNEAPNDGRPARLAARPKLDLIAYR
jgi:hypothetical protein